MTLIRLCFKEFCGLFIDDGSLATLSLLLIGGMAGLVKLLGLPGLWAAGLLLAGCLAILCHSVLRAARKG